MTRFCMCTELSCVLIGTTLGASWAWSAEMFPPPSAAPTQRVAVLGGADFDSFDGRTVWTAATFAPSGLDASGFRFGTFAGAGTYSYGMTSGVRGGGKFVTVDSMLGWAVATEKSNTKLLLGVNFQDQELNQPDPTNPVQGSKTGFKAQLDSYISPTPTTMIFGLGSYSTAFETYYAEAKVGMAISRDNSAFIGPQVIALGNARFDQWRVGAHLSSIHFGLIDVSISGGYLQDSSNGSGAYGAISGYFRF